TEVRTKWKQFDRALRTLWSRERILALHLHVRDVVVDVADHHSGVDPIAHVQLLKFALRLDRVLHGHGLHPVADFARGDGRGLCRRVERLDLALHRVALGGWRLFTT